jgi:hypothetical protein
MQPKHYVVDMKILSGTLNAFFLMIDYETFITEIDTILNTILNKETSSLNGCNSRIAFNTRNDDKL